MLHSNGGSYRRSKIPLITAFCTLQVQNALYVIRYMRATDPSATPEIRDEGLCLYALRRYEEAASCLAAYLAADPDALDAATVTSVMERARAKAAGTA